MSDDTATPETEVEDTEQTPVETPDPAADLEKQRAEFEAEKKRLEREKRNLNKWSMELAEREKRGVTIKDDEPLDPEVEKLLDKYAEKKLAPQLEIAHSAYAAAVTSELDRFAEKNGVDPEVIEDIIQSGKVTFRDSSIASVREGFSQALAFHKASNFNEDEYRAKLKAEILADLTKDGEKIEGIRPKRTEVSTGADEDSLDSGGLYSLFKSRTK